jgi:hypothetical protein
MQTFLQTIHEVQTSLIPEISMKKVNKICSNRHVTFTDVLMVSYAVHNLIENDAIDTSVLVTHHKEAINRILNANNIYLKSDITDCLKAGADIQGKEMDARNKQMLKDRYKS